MKIVDDLGIYVIGDFFICLISINICIECLSFELIVKQSEKRLTIGCKLFKINLTV